jgi:hypothetical protein
MEIGDKRFRRRLNWTYSASAMGQEGVVSETVYYAS